MQWIHSYQFFLFDLDGLLVNTEEIHYQAYKEMCARRNVHLTWDFLRYAKAAHYQATGLRDQLYAEFPALKSNEPDWDVLYKEKTQAYFQFLNKGAAQLMPGVAPVLEALHAYQIPSCVVTHSALALVERLRQQNPILNTIPYWLTREDYFNPKPHSECYQLAISRYTKHPDKIIGFEDTPRGLQALLGTNAKPILVSPSAHLYSHLHLSVKHYPSFEMITDTNPP
jgi:HAD superfamily hydrolase (TIGR01509 family)